MLTNFIYTLRELFTSGFPFAVTGSHFFGTAMYSSDVDFFTSSNVNRGWLKSLGFNQITSAYTPSDVNTAEVWRWRNTSGFQIDIQIVKDVDLKIRVQNNLLFLGFTNPSKEMWNVAYHYEKEMTKRGISFSDGSIPHSIAEKIINS